MEGPKEGRILDDLTGCPVMEQREERKSTVTGRLGECVGLTLQSSD